jgi:hypothetical protein
MSRNKNKRTNRNKTPIQASKILSNKGFVLASIISCIAILTFLVLILEFLSGPRMNSSDSENVNLTGFQSDVWESADEILQKREEYSKILESLKGSKILDRIAIPAIAKENLYYADGLPGNQKPDVEKCYENLKLFALHVAAETRRSMYKFEQAPLRYENSEAYFRMLVMVSVIQQDFKVRYKPEFMADRPSRQSLSDNSFSKNSEDLFIHGLLTGKREGTCASMPVLYCAIARMLNYPVKLVPAKGHLFIRWEDGKERRNFEVTSKGLNSYPDSYYTKFPYYITDKEMQNGFYLESLDENGESAIFLESRGHCLLANDKPEEASECFKASNDLNPKQPYLKRYMGYCQLSLLDQKISKEVAALRLTQQFPLTGPDPKINKQNNQLLCQHYKENIDRLAQQKHFLKSRILEEISKDVMVPYSHEDKKGDIETGNADFFDIESEIEKDKILTKPKPRDTDIELELNK